ERVLQRGPWPVGAAGDDVEQVADLGVVAGDGFERDRLFGSAGGNNERVGTQDVEVGGDVVEDGDVAHAETEPRRMVPAAFGDDVVGAGVVVVDRREVVD